jgi:hypothetical protein
MDEQPPNHNEPIFTRKFGPRTDVRYMTRAELFKSATQTLVGGLLLLGGCAGLGWFVAHGSSLVVIAGFFVALVLSAMGIVGALYLCVRGVLRSPSYDPQAVRWADQAKWMKREGLEDQ